MDENQQQNDFGDFVPRRLVETSNQEAGFMRQVPVPDNKVLCKEQVTPHNGKAKGEFSKVMVHRLGHESFQPKAFGNKMGQDHSNQR